MHDAENTEVIVAGGGVAGIVAALQAARAGAQTLLVERSGRLGGTLTNAMIGWPGLFHAWGKQVIAGIGWELVERCCAEEGTPLPDFRLPPAAHYHHQVRLSEALFSLLAEEAVHAAGVRLLGHCMFAEVRETPEAIEAVLCTKTGLQPVRAEILIDCTGDANALALAGCPLRIPAVTQPGTLSCRATGYDPATLDGDALQHAAEQAQREGRLRPGDCSFDPQRVQIAGWLRSGGNNSGHVYHVNAVDSAGRSRMEREAGASLLRIYRFLRQQPGLQNLRLDALSAECGVRETATFVGRDTITLADYTSGRHWPDALCHSFYPIDLHDDQTGLDYRKLAPGTVPTVGRGALLPVERQRLLGAGRCLSSDRLANSALRVQATCMATGQAAGAMAALSCRRQVPPAQLDLRDIRALLREHGAIVP